MRRQKGVSTVQAGQMAGRIDDELIGTTYFLASAANTSVYQYIHFISGENSIILAATQGISSQN